MQSNFSCKEDYKIKIFKAEVILSPKRRNVIQKLSHHYVQEHLSLMLNTTGEST